MNIFKNIEDKVKSYKLFYCEGCLGNYIKITSWKVEVDKIINKIIPFWVVRLNKYKLISRLSSKEFDKGGWKVCGIGFKRLGMFCNICTKNHEKKYKSVEENQ